MDQPSVERGHDLEEEGRLREKRYMSPKSLDKKEHPQHTQGVGVVILVASIYSLQRLKIKDSSMT